MEKRILKIGRWKVTFFFVIENYDKEKILVSLFDAGAPDEILDRVEEIMDKGSLDCGFTYTNPWRYLAVTVIGPVSSKEEFINTLTHEIHHLAVAIAENLGLSLESETPAYISGDLAREFAALVCRLGCPHCKL